MTNEQLLKNLTIPSKIKDADVTVSIPYFFCPRCEINTTTKDRMIPCPRGGCDAIRDGSIELTFKYNPE